MTYTGANRSGASEHSLSHDQEMSFEKEAPVLAAWSKSWL